MSQDHTLQAIGQMEVLQRKSLASWHLARQELRLS